MSDLRRRLHVYVVRPLKFAAWAFNVSFGTCLIIWAIWSLFSADPVGTVWN